MSTPDRSGTSRESEGSGEAGTSGVQLVRLEDLQDMVQTLVQTLVQRAIADGGSQQAPVVGTSGERFRGYIRVVEQLFCPLVGRVGVTALMGFMAPLASVSGEASRTVGIRPKAALGGIVPRPVHTDTPNRQR